MSEQAITRDLMAKLGDDVSSAMFRTMSLVGERQRLPVAMSAGAVCIGIIGAILNQAGGGEQGEAPDPQCVLLAGLLVARTGIGGDDPIADAYRDLQLLQKAEVQP